MTWTMSASVSRDSDGPHDGGSLMCRGSLHLNSRPLWCMTLSASTRTHSSMRLVMKDLTWHRAHSVLATSTACNEWQDDKARVQRKKHATHRHAHARTGGTTWECNLRAQPGSTEQHSKQTSSTRLSTWSVPLPQLSQRCCNRFKS